MLHIFNYEHSLPGRLNRTSKTGLQTKDTYASEQTVPHPPGCGIFLDCGQEKW